MPLVNADGKWIYFAHVPKCGGSSVEEYLVRRFGGPLSLRDITHRSRKRRRGLIALSTHFTAEDLTDILAPEHIDASFAVVREPLSRVASQYRFQAGISKTRSLDFSTWLRVMIAAWQKDPRVYQNHIRPQSELVPDGAQVFRLEDGFAEMIAWLDQVTGRTAPQIEVGHFLKRAHTPIAMSREDVALIKRVYAADYARFGYAPPELKGRPGDGLAPLRDWAGLALAQGVVWKQRRHWLA